MSLIKKILVIVIILAVSPPMFILGYNYFADAPLSPVLKQYTSQALPEDVLDNAAIDLAVIMRPEEIEMDEAIQRVRYMRGQYNLFQPEMNKPLYPEFIPATEESVVDVPLFKGIPDMFYCWLTLSGKYDMCLKDFAVQQMVVQNGLYMARYNKLLRKQNFVGDAVVNIPGSFMNIALLYMVQTSYTFDQGQQEKAFLMWRTQHRALKRFMKGSHHLMAMAQLSAAHRYSLILLERMLYLGLDQRYYPVIKKELMPEGIDRINIDGVLRADIGFNVRQIQQYFRPHGLRLVQNGYRWLVPGPVHKPLNEEVAPVVEQYHALASTPPTDMRHKTESYQIQTQTDQNRQADTLLSNGKALDAAQTLAAYLNSGVHIMPLIYDLEAREKAMLLALRIKQENVSPSRISAWLEQQTDMVNPATGEPFEYKKDSHALVFTNSDGQEISSYIMPVE